LSSHHSILFFNYYKIHYRLNLFRSIHSDHSGLAQYNFGFSHSAWCY